MWKTLPSNQKLLAVSLLLLVFVLPLGSISSLFQIPQRTQSQASTGNGSVTVVIEPQEGGLNADQNGDFIIKMNTQGGNVSHLTLALQVNLSRAIIPVLPTVSSSVQSQLAVSPETVLTVTAGGQQYISAFNATIIFDAPTTSPGFSSTSLVEVGRISLSPYSNSYHPSILITVDNQNSTAHFLNSTDDVLSFLSTPLSFPIIFNPDRCLNQLSDLHFQELCPNNTQITTAYNQTLQCNIHTCEPPVSLSPNAIEWNFNDFQLKASTFSLQIDDQTMLVNPSAIFGDFYEYGDAQSGWHRDVTMLWFENDQMYRWFMRFDRDPTITTNWRMVRSNIEQYVHGYTDDYSYSLNFTPFTTSDLVDTVPFRLNTFSSSLLPGQDAHTGLLTITDLQFTMGPYTPTTPTPTPTPVYDPCTQRPWDQRANFDNQGRVDIDDYPMLFGEIFKTLPTYIADTDCDHDVDLEDYAVFWSEFLK